MCLLNILAGGQMDYTLNSIMCCCWSAQQHENKENFMHRGLYYKAHGDKVFVFQWRILSSTVFRQIVISSFKIRALWCITWRALQPLTTGIGKQRVMWLRALNDVTKAEAQWPILSSTILRTGTWYSLAKINECHFPVEPLFPQSAWICPFSTSNPETYLSSVSNHQDDA